MTKYILTLSLAAFLALPVTAQTDKEVTLSEVEVTAARTTTTTNGLRIVPTDWQKEHSATTYSLLQKLSLHSIRIDEALMSIEAINPQEKVQIRINDVVPTRADLLKLDPKEIKNIDFIDNPGVRYGSDISYVVSIWTRRGSQGYTIGSTLANSVTAYRGDNSVYGSYISGKSEWGWSYEMGYSDLKGYRTAENASYALDNGDICRISRNDNSGRQSKYSNNLKLTYTLSAENKYTLYLTAALDHANSPHKDNERLISEENNEFIATKKATSHSLSPVFDFYYNVHLGERQSLTSSLNATSIRTQTNDSYDEGGLYNYHVAGKTRSLRAEAIYENRLKPFTLSLGANYFVKHTINEYSNDINADIRFLRHNVYFFAQIGGYAGKWSYNAGMGGNYLSYRQAETRWNRLFWRPKATLAYAPTDRIQLKYTYEMLPYTSTIATVNDVMIKVNSREWKRGNPELSSYYRQEHELSVSYSTQRLQASLTAFYRVNRHPNMGYYERQADNTYVYRQKNMGKCNVFSTMAQLSADIVPQKLTTFIYGGIYRFFNYSDYYTHLYTSFNGGASIQAYLGRWTLEAYADNGWRFMEGENKGYSGYSVYLSASYKVGRCTVSGHLQHPLSGTATVEKNEIINEMVRKSTATTSTNQANLLTVSVTWRLSKGKKTASTKRPATRKDTDSGILR